MAESPVARRLVLRHVLKSQAFKLLWRKTVVELAVTPQATEANSVFMRPMLWVERPDACGGSVEIPLASSDERSWCVRLLSPSREDAQTYTFVLRRDAASTILRLRAPSGESYRLWTSIIVAAMRSGHSHSTWETALCSQCLVFFNKGMNDLLDGSKRDDHTSSIGPAAGKETSIVFSLTPITLPSSPDRLTTTLVELAVGEVNRRWSSYSSSVVVEPPSVNASTLCFQLHLALLRESFTETWSMEVRKNLLLRVSAHTLRVSIWSPEAVMAALRLRAVRTFQPMFDLFVDSYGDKSEIPMCALTEVATVLQQSVYVVAEHTLESEHAMKSRDCRGGCTRCHTPKFRVYSPISGERECDTSAVNWLRQLSSEVLKARQSPIVLHVTDRSACSLLRFSELQSRPKRRLSSINRRTLDLSNAPDLESAS